jgi:hypothetical protein
VTGAIEQPHVRPWSTALRVPTKDGDLWFKANVPSQAYEAAIVTTLARDRPDCVPELDAVDLDTGWMLMRDAGTLLRDVVERDRDLSRWLEVLPGYAELQLGSAQAVDGLIAAGVPDHRLAVLATQYDELLQHAKGLTPEEHARLSELRHRVRHMCEDLGDYRIPETIQHDDLHDGQVYVRANGYIFSDWADACVSHPFFSMAVTLEGNISWGLDDIEASVDTTPFGEAYLEPFAGYGSRRELRAALAIALRLGWVCRAINVQRWASALDPPDREKHLQGVAIRLRMFLSGL